MGNCFQPMPSNPPEKRAKVVFFNGEEEEFTASTTVERLISGHFSKYQLVHRHEPSTALPPHYQLIAGETYHLVPRLAGSSKPPLSQRIGAGDRPAEGPDDWIKVMVPNCGLEDRLQVQKIMAKEMPVLVSGSSWACTEAQPEKVEVTAPQASADP